MIDKIILVFCFTMYGPHTSFISIPHSHLLIVSCYSLFSVNILGSEKKNSVFSKILLLHNQAWPDPCVYVGSGLQCILNLCQLQKFCSRQTGSAS